MPAKVTKSLTLDTLIKDIRKEAKKEKRLRDRVVALIKRYIMTGRSPVMGQGKFQKYSKKYAKEKGFSKPNMKVTGDMLNSFDHVDSSKPGNFKIVIRDEKADFHNRLGAGRSKVIRRLLPTVKNERFDPKVRERIVNVFFGAARRAIKKQRR